MASADIALVCGLNFQVGCQDRLRVNSDADEALAQWDSRSEWGACSQPFFFSADVTSNIVFVWWAMSKKKVENS